MKPIQLCLFVLVTTMLLGTVVAEPQSDAVEVTLPVQEYLLDNGLRVLLLERHNAPTVACQIAFRIGSANEHNGVTGAAHMLEHMMFKGSQRIGTTNYQAEVPLMAEIDRVALQIIQEQQRGEKADQDRIASWRKELKDLQNQQQQYIVSEEFANIYKQQGASQLNAYTSSDYTNFIVQLPSNKLELWCWLESDRIANPVFREFYTEKEVVREERRMRYEDSPLGAMWELFCNTAYTAHPYQWLTIGYGSDIDFYQRKVMEDYFDRYYAPNNAVVVWVGDFQTEEALKLIKKYFGNLPARETPPPVITKEPEQRGERRAVLEFDSNPMLLMGWHTCEIASPDQAVLDVLEGILSRGRTSRLYRKLRERELVSDISAWGPMDKYPGLFVVMAEPLQGVPLEAVETAILSEITDLKENLVSDWELQRVKNQMTADFVRSLESNYTLARNLAEKEAKGSWRLETELAQKRQEVTAEEVREAARRYLNQSNQTVVTLVPNQAPPQPDQI